MNTLVIRSHQGLGDMLIINAIVRDRAAKFDRVFLPCKTHNVPSVAFMFRDLSNVTVVSVKDDEDAALQAHRIYAKGSTDIMALGMFGPKPFYMHLWDYGIYFQAKVPFDDRWDKWKVERKIDSEVAPPALVFRWAFVHSDPARNFNIDSKKLPDHYHLYPDRRVTDNLFNWWQIIENAEEIHCIDSVFAILADSIPTKATRHVLHLYARPGANPPHYRKNWEILT